jgi:hypothetical protein
MGVGFHNGRHGSLLAPCRVFFSCWVSSTVVTPLDPLGTVYPRSRCV